MRQSQLDRAVARITGERISTIRRMGFSPLAAPSEEAERPVRVSDRDRPNNPHRTYFPPCGNAHTAA
jgi:hypothetical protein